MLHLQHVQYDSILVTTLPERDHPDHDPNRQLSMVFMGIRSPIIDHCVTVEM